MNGERTTLYPYANTFRHGSRHGSRLGFDDYDGLDHFSIEDRPHPDDEEAVHLYGPLHAPYREPSYRSQGASSGQNWAGENWRAQQAWREQYLDWPVRTGYRDPAYQGYAGRENFRGAGNYDEANTRYGTAPNFRGVAPKGYGRSDQRIKEDVCEHLTEDADVDATQIDVNVREGVVELSGVVNDRRQKFRAEYLADAVRGVHDVLNHLQINRPRDGGVS